MDSEGIREIKPAEGSITGKRRERGMMYKILLWLDGIL